MPLSSLPTAVDEICGLELARVPASVVARTGHVIADTLAVVAAGARSPQVRALAAADEADGLLSPAARPGPVHSASVLTEPRRRAHPADAAFLNATAGTFLELDEGTRPSGHPAMHVVPAALAVAEARGASGAQLLRAVLAGYEISARLFRAVRLRPGAHPHGNLGAVGAAVAVALLEDTDPAAAAVIAATTPLLSTWQACYDGATARNTYTGHGARSGVRAAGLARAGFTGSAGALEAAFGGIAGEPADTDALTAPLNYSELAITRNYFKVHSACALSHSAIEAALSLSPLRPDQVHQVRVDTVAVNLKIDTQPAQNALSTRFSLPYAVAAALTLGRSDPDAFTYRAEVASLASRVEVHVDDALDAQWPTAAPARVTVLTDAENRTAEVRDPRGHHTRPLSAPELREKFLGLLSNQARAPELWERLNRLSSVADCAELFREVFP
ncbi:MmgE/PrpD family protein [Streptomyces werraensis]|uniref:MmgE/PrpD family protein n=1 Tax=Streptomyces werraensis TaxID=68284 RepID=UPI00381B1080